MYFCFLLEKKTEKKIGSLSKIKSRIFPKKEISLLQKVILKSHKDPNMFL